MQHLRAAILRKVETGFVSDDFVPPWFHSRDPSRCNEKKQVKYKETPSFPGFPLDAELFITRM